MSAFVHIIYWNYQKLTSRRNCRNSNLWIFGEWWGKRCNDNVCSFANYISVTYPNVDCIWITESTTNSTKLNSRIKIIEWKTPEADKAIKSAGVIVVNQNLQDLDNGFNFSCSGAVIINLWHGVPWKKIGLDAIHEKRKLYYFYQKYVLKLQKFDAFACPGKEYEDIYKRAFCLNTKQVLRVGQTRNSVFYDSTEVKSIRKRLVQKIGSTETIRIISYLPTFRDAHTKPFSFAEIKDQFFHEWLEHNNIYIIQKAHAAETGIISSGSNHIINLNDISAQELMAASDMLVTDYSSCFFDYLLLDRPVIHYLYDYDFYKYKDRGLYYDKEDIVCGSAPETVEELIQAIKVNFENPELYHALRMERKEKFMTYESPDSCDIITQRIFEELRKRGMKLP